MGCFLGLQFFNPKCFPIAETRLGHYLAELTKVLSMSPNLVMIVIPNNKVCSCIGALPKMEGFFLN
jgi:hypothetical protein